MRALIQIGLVITLTCGLVALVLHTEKQFSMSTQSTPSVVADTTYEDRDDPLDEPLEKLTAEALAAERPADLRAGAARQVAAVSEPGFSELKPAGPAAPAITPSNPPTVPATSIGAETPAAPQTLTADAAGGAARPIGDAPADAMGLRQPSGPRNDRASPYGAAAPANPTADEALKTTEPLELMRRLRSDDATAKAAARQELVRRGFTEVDFELARRLLDPEPTVRKQLAQSIPQLTSVDAVPWLMLLASDPDPDVRMASITTLATTGDPALLDRIENLARQDTDSRILELAEHIARQRNMAGSRGETTTARGGARTVVPR